MKKSFESPKFIKSSVNPKEFPLIKDDRGKYLKEVAVVGRSNVGKSSLLGSLFKMKNLVKVSQTPGKTQVINFFSLGNQYSIVDLPGYGFAKVPLEIRKNWGPMIQTYLNKREPLELILFLMDIRRIPNEEDLQLMEWIGSAGKGVILVLTKVDKVSSNEKVAQTDKILKAFHQPNLHYVHYSVPKEIGREPLIKMIEDAFQGEE